ncbi:YLS9 protein [Spatholobus suberectus]|nr:YLS9 protein [Spatholobus suberectus]
MYLSLDGVDIYHNNIEVLALYQNVQFRSQTLGPFFQHPKNTTMLGLVFKGQCVVHLGVDRVLDLDKEKGLGDLFHRCEIVHNGSA